MIAFFILVKKNLDDRGTSNQKRAPQAKPRISLSDNQRNEDLEEIRADKFKNTKKPALKPKPNFYPQQQRNTENSKRIVKKAKNDSSDDDSDTIHEAL